MAEASGRLNRAARVFGQLLTVLALIYIAFALFQNRAELGTWRPTGMQIGIFGGLVLGYAALLMLLALNWAKIVEMLVLQAPPRAALMLSYTKSQIAKYVPGNVMHLVGRHMLLRDHGVDHRPLAVATLLEVLSLALAALLAICLGVLVLVRGNLSPVLPFGSFEAAMVFAVITLAIFAGSAARGYALKGVLGVMVRGTLFMLGQGAILAIVYYALDGVWVNLAVPAAIAAWLGGFLTPGAPGGLGIREALLLTILAPATQSETLLLAIVVLRIITTLGDLCLALFGAALFGHSAEQP